MSQSIGGAYRDAKYRREDRSFFCWRAGCGVTLTMIERVPGYDPHLPAEKAEPYSGTRDTLDWDGDQVLLPDAMRPDEDGHYRLGKRARENYLKLAGRYGHRETMKMVLGRRGRHNYDGTRRTRTPLPQYIHLPVLVECPRCQLIQWLRGALDARRP